MDGISIQSVRPQGRINRKPSHPFQLRHRPWQIQPFFIAPVLPGETMKNLLLQARVVSDPVKNSLIGWWIEYYFFYVKLRDLDDRQVFQDMLLDPTKNTSALNSAAKVETYHGWNTVDYVDKCLTRVTDTFFRAEGETASGFTLGNLPAAQIGSDTVLDSAINNASFNRPDVNVDLNANATITASEVDQALRQWQWLRSNNLTTASYEDFLRSYGVSVPRQLREETHWPELVRYVKDWTYPTNTINPADGSPSAALSWSVAERADKDRFFREPGFLFGVTVARPKVYLSKVSGSFTGMMTDAVSWLPALLRDDPMTSMKKVAAATAPLTANTDAYWVDLRDLFMYGEQFVNFALTATDAGMVALPTAALQKRYASAADADALFRSASPLNQVRQDGLVSLTVASALDDATGTV